MYHEIIIIGLILRVNNVQKRLIKSNAMTISMEYGEYNFSSEHKKKSEYHDQLIINNTYL